MNENESPQRKKPPKSKVLTTREKVLIGGLGALTPVFLNFLVLDIEKIFSKLTLIVFAAYLARVLFLFYLGGIVAYLHKREHDALKLFELGIVAPALLTSVVNASVAARAEAAMPPPPQQKEVSEGAQFSIPSFDFIPSAYAQPSPTPDESPKLPGTDESVKAFSPPQETTTEQIFRGLIGSTSSRIWYVVIGSYSSLENAKRQAAEVNRRHSAFSAEVFKPYDTPYYAVVIGANLTLKDATSLKKRALSARVATEAYLKRGPGPV